MPVESIRDNLKKWIPSVDLGDGAGGDFLSIVVDGFKEALVKGIEFAKKVASEVSRMRRS